MGIFYSGKDKEKWSDSWNVGRRGYVSQHPTKYLLTK